VEKRHDAANRCPLPKMDSRETGRLLRRVLGMALYRVVRALHCFHLVSQPWSAAYFSWSPMLLPLSAARSFCDMLLFWAICRTRILHQH
jgi:hypothetical protein